MSVKVKIRRADDGTFDAQIIARNGQVVWTTHRQGYARKAGVENAIAVITAGAYWNDIYKRPDGRFDARVVANNGRIVWTTHRQGYERRRDAERAIEALNNISCFEIISD